MGSFLGLPTAEDRKMISTKVKGNNYRFRVINGSWLFNCRMRKKAEKQGWVNTASMPGHAISNLHR